MENGKLKCKWDNEKQKITNSKLKYKSEKVKWGFRIWNEILKFENGNAKLENINRNWQKWIQIKTGFQWNELDQIHWINKCVLNSMKYNIVK